MRDRAVLIKLTPDEKLKIEKFAKERGIGMATLIRMAVIDHIGVNESNNFNHINQFLK